MTTRRGDLSPQAAAIVAVEHPNPHSYLGVHETADGWRLRVWRPEAVEVTAIIKGGTRVALDRLHAAGLFEAALDREPSSYTLELGFRYGATLNIDDPYRFWPTLGEVDLHLIGEGRHERLWEALGAHQMSHQGVDGTAFSVWAPAARSVRVIGDFNYWDGRVHPMRVIGASGVWELFLPGVGDHAQYKFEILTQDVRTQQKTDPIAQATERPPGSAAVVFTSRYDWNDDEWLASRATTDLVHQRLSTYEVHLGSWKRVPE